MGRSSRCPLSSPIAALGADIVVGRKVPIRDIKRQSIISLAGDAVETAADALKSDLALLP
jgi:hypothetical protein